MKSASGPLWMPFTSAGGSEPPVVVAGDGNYLETDDGTRLLDGTAGGVACVILGHGRTEIADAVGDQLRTLEYHCLFGYSHPRAQELAEAVAARTPGDLNHVFFTNSGSEAVETALKMARGYWRRVGQATKTGFVSLHRGYHGMNVGGISVGGLTENRSGFGPLLEGCTQVPAHEIDALERELVYRDPSTVAAVIMEPVQAAGGVYPPPEDYLSEVRAMCDRHDVLLVLDEVVCGFGRLGHWFGGHRYGVVPDIMTVAKGLTSAYIPMGAAVASSRVHEAFVDPEGSIELMHGYTYSGHPAACVAGLKVIEILEREGLVDHSLQTGRHLQERVGTLWLPCQLWPKSGERGCWPQWSWLATALSPSWPRPSVASSLLECWCGPKPTTWASTRRSRSPIRRWIEWSKPSVRCWRSCRDKRPS